MFPQDDSASGESQHASIATSTKEGQRRQRLQDRRRGCRCRWVHRRERNESASAAAGMIIAAAIEPFGACARRGSPIDTPAPPLPQPPERTRSLPGNEAVLNGNDPAHARGRSRHSEPSTRDRPCEPDPPSTKLGNGVAEAWDRRGAGVTSTRLVSGNRVRGCLHRGPGSVASESSQPPRRSRGFAHGRRKRRRSVGARGQRGCVAAR